MAGALWMSAARIGSLGSLSFCLGSSCLPLFQKQSKTRHFGQRWDTEKMDRQVEQVILVNAKQQAKHSWPSENVCSWVETGPWAIVIQHLGLSTLQVLSSQLLPATTVFILQVRDAGCGQGCTVTG